MACTAAWLAADGVDLAVADGVADRVADGLAVACAVAVAAEVGAALDSVPVGGGVPVRMAAVSRSGRNSSTATVPPKSNATATTSSETSTRDRRGFPLRARAKAPPSSRFRLSKPT